MKVKGSWIVSKFVRVLLMLLLQFSIPPIPYAKAAPADGETLESAVSNAVRLYLGAPPRYGLVISNVKTIGEWSYGTIGVMAAPVDGAGPQGLLFLARNSDGNWQVAIEHTTTFNSWLAQTPDSLVSANAKKIMDGNRPSGDGSALLSLPWAPGETWQLYGGPHNNDGDDANGNPITARPWSAIDFARAGGRVHAAREGIAYLACANFVLIRHLDGWETGYYHLNNIAVSNEQFVSRGQYLGDISSLSGCGGTARGAHVHFTLRLNGVFQETNGRDIGGWTVQEGSAPYQGCMQRITTGARQCAPSGQIYNDDTIGSGGCSFDNYQIVLYSDLSYTGSCTTLGVGDYANAAAMGFADNDAESILLGNNVQAVLCKDENFLGGCATVTSNVDNLDTTPVGRNQLSSLKVQTRYACYTLVTNVNPFGAGAVGKAPAPDCGSGSQYTVGTVVQLAATATNAYTFTNWTGDASGSANPITVTMTANKSVTANFLRACYSLTTNQNPAGGGTVLTEPSPNCTGTQYTLGTLVGLKAVASGAYTFTNWSGDVSGTANPIFFNIDNNKSVTANFINSSLTFRIYLPMVVQPTSSFTNALQSGD